MLQCTVNDNCATAGRAAFDNVDIYLQGRRSCVCKDDVVVRELSDMNTSLPSSTVQYKYKYVVVLASRRKGKRMHRPRLLSLTDQ
jgi:hypothetical protein